MLQNLSLEEKIAFDNITTMAFSMAFLKGYSENVFDPIGQKISILEFYRKWHFDKKFKNYHIPFNPGIFLGSLFVGILYAKENWYDIIPEIPLPLSGEWGFFNTFPDNPKNQNLNLRQFIRRVRNSLGHGYAHMIAPPISLNNKNLLHIVQFEFKDKNIRDPHDTFKVILSMYSLTIFMSKFHYEIRSKIAPGTYADDLLS